MFHKAYVNSLERSKYVAVFDFLASSKVSMFTRAIFMRPDSEPIRESACACPKLFVDEENVQMAQIKSWKNKNIDGFYITYYLWEFVLTDLLLYFKFLHYIPR